MSTLIYCRVSTQGQSDDGSSLESQVVACQKYAEDNNLIVSRTVKEVFSGAYLFDRPQLNLIRDELRAGSVTNVIILAVDRLSRNVGHLCILLDEFERYGATLHFVTENLDNTPEGKLLQSVKGYVGEIEREKIRERTMRGRRHKALNGTLNHGRRLYGYTVLDGKRQLCPTESIVALSLFERVKGGESLREIAADLNAQQIPTPQGREGSVWWAASIGSIIKNPAYAGHSTVFRYKHTQKFIEGRRSTTCSITDPESWITLPSGTTPQLVSQDDFDAVQAIMSSNKTNKRARPHREYLLRGFVRCGNCGRSMSPQMSHSRFRSYVCTSKQNPTTNCGTKMLKAELSEHAVWSEIESLIREPDRLADRIIASANCDVGQVEASRGELRSIQSTIARTESEMSNLIRRSETSDDAMWSMFEARLKVKQRELDNLKVLERTVLKELDVATAAQIDLKDFEANRLRMYATLDKMTFNDRVDILKSFGLGVRWDGAKLKASVYTQYGSKSNFDGF